MSDGANIYGMISGIGKSFDDSYAAGRQRALEAEAPAIFGQLLGLNGGPSTAPAQGATLGTLGQVQPASSARAVPTFVGLSGTNPSADKKMNGSNADFVSAMLPHAIEASKATGVDPRIILAQSAIETGFGRSAPGNNYFGIKSHGEAGGNTMATTEVVDGQPVRVNDSFRAFPSMAASAAGYADFLNKNPRYAGLKSAQGLEAQAAALQASGYATDPHYGGKVLSIARRLPLPNGAGAAPAPGQPVAVANNEAETQALEQRMGMVPGQTAQADMPAPGAIPAGFVIPGQTPAAPAAAPAPAAPQGFAGFGTGASRMSPEQAAVLQTAWRNPVTRPMATQIYGELLKGQASPWKLQQMGDQPVLFNERTAQIVPVGQGKRSTTTVGNAVVDTATGQVIYQGDQEPKTATVGSTIVDTRTGQPIYSAPEKPTTVAPGSTLVTPEGRVIFQSPTKDDKDEGAKISSQIEARRQAAAGLGLTEGTPEWRSYVGTGKIGRDQDLSATDRKAIQEADEGVLSAQTAIEALNQAKTLSKQAYEGPTAGTRSAITSLVGSEAGVATEDLNNVVTTNALGQLKAIFGGNPTEGERAILLKIQGSVNQPDVVRQKIFDRGIALAQKRLEFNQRRAEDLRGGTYYKQDGAPGGAKASIPKGEARLPIPDGKSAAAALAEAQSALQARPDLKPQLQERLRSWGIDPKRLDN